MVIDSGERTARGEPPLRHWRHFLEVVRSPSLRVAAEAAHISQSALSQAILGLERHLGVRLLERTRRGVCPTGEGRLLAERLARVFDLLAELGRLGSPRHAPGFVARVGLPHLRAMRAVAEHGGFSPAAAAGPSLSALHRGARGLEALLGVPLFERTSHGVRPTRRGAEAARLAGLALRELELAVDALRARAGRAPLRLPVGALPLVRAALLPRAVARLLARMPDVDVEVVDAPYAVLLDMLRSGRVDVVFGALRRPPPVADVVEEELFVDRLHAVVRAGHPLLSASPPEPDALARYPWVVPRREAPARRAFAALLGGRRPAALVEAGSFAMARGLLRATDAVALLSRHHVAHELESGELALLPVEVPGSERVIGATVRRDGRLLPAHRLLIEALRTEAASAGEPITAPAACAGAGPERMAAGRR